jgi:ribosomal protein S18 acetylase RimI-like enzyme
VDAVERLTALTPDGPVVLDLLPCDPALHGQYIRDHARSAFAPYMRDTVGWDEARNEQEPRTPANYRMVCEGAEIIGFFAARPEADALYLQSILLVPDRRRRGYGTALLRHIEEMARTQGRSRVRLRVYKANPARAWYRRHGYRVATNERYSLIMEKVVTDRLSAGADDPTKGRA